MADAQPPPYSEINISNTVPIPAPVVVSVESKPNDRFVSSVLDTDIRTAFYYYSIFNWFVTLPIMYLAISYGVFAIPFSHNLFITICAIYNDPTCLDALRKISLSIQFLLWTVGPIYVIYFEFAHRDISAVLFVLIWFGIVYFIYLTFAMYRQINFATDIKDLVMYERRNAIRSRQN